MEQCQEFLEVEGWGEWSRDGVGSMVRAHADGRVQEIPYTVARRLKLI